MIRSRTALAVAACLAGALGSSIAVAQADSQGATGTTGTTGATVTPATITVNGSATATLASDSSSDAVSTAYLGALTSALTAAHTKAATLSSAVGDTLGTVENITEQSNNSGLCSGPMLFNAAGSAKGAPSVAPTPVKKHKHHSSTTKGAMARIADVAATCTIEADVTVTYAMAPA
jgi:uncharacterized protein YggE